MIFLIRKNVGLMTSTLGRADFCLTGDIGMKFWNLMLDFNGAYGYAFLFKYDNSRTHQTNLVGEFLEIRDTR